MEDCTLPGNDTDRILYPLAKKHEVDFDNLDDNIKAMMRDLAEGSLDGQRLGCAMASMAQPDPFQWPKDEPSTT